jgi:hypothetical protein
MMRRLKRMTDWLRTHVPPTLRREPDPESEEVRRQIARVEAEQHRMRSQLQLLDAEVRVMGRRPR